MTDPIRGPFHHKIWYDCITKKITHIYNQITQSNRHLNVAIHGQSIINRVSNRLAKGQKQTLRKINTHCDNSIAQNYEQYSKSPPYASVCVFTKGVKNGATNS